MISSLNARQVPAREGLALLRRRPSLSPGCPPNPQKAQPLQSRSDSLSGPPSLGARLLAALAVLWGCLPLRLARLAGSIAGVSAYALSPRYRHKVDGNLAQAGLAGRALRWRVAAQSGQTLAELPCIWRLTPAQLSRRVATRGYELIDRTRAEGAGILFLTPHLGAFDLAARYYAAAHPITVMFRPPRRPILDLLIGRARNSAGMRAVPASLAGVRAMIRALRAGQAVGLLPDQVPTGGEGQWTDFFGRPAYTMTLPGRLAASARVRVLLARAERVRAGWRLSIEPLEGGADPQTLNAAMERLIRACPEQYLWGYSRYRAPPGAGSALAKDRPC